MSGRLAYWKARAKLDQQNYYLYKERGDKEQATRALVHFTHALEQARMIELGIGGETDDTIA